MHSLVALAVGLATWVILEVLGIPLALFFGFMAFVLEYIPNIGSVIATVLPMPLVLLDPEVSWIKMVLTFVLPALAHVRIYSVFFPLTSSLKERLNFLYFTQHTVLIRSSS